MKRRAITDDRFAESQKRFEEALLRQAEFEADTRSKFQQAALAFSTLASEHRRALERVLAMLVAGRVDELKRELLAICAEPLPSRIEMPGDVRH